MTTSEKIEKIRQDWGDKLCLLAHYYQRDEIVRHADFIGDSLELAKKAAAAKGAEKIVFCGVHFMAESADILTGKNQTVYMPDPNAGCPMADMAPLRKMLKAWHDITAFETTNSMARLPHTTRQDKTEWVPIAYVNSNAAIKAFCGEHGGATCTSSNAGKIVAFFVKQNKRILFLPDEHLGSNTARDMGLPDDAVVVFEPGKPLGGKSHAQIKKARILTWKGYCHVHIFHVDDVKKARAEHPGARIIVHPETPKEVSRLTDAHGSTSYIVKYVENAPAGSTIVIGTELNLVKRLAALHAGRVAVYPLRPSVCHDMALTTEEKLLAVMKKWPEENEIHVDAELKSNAALALERMLEIS